MELITLRVLEGNATTSLGVLQQTLAPYLDVFLALWWMVFISTTCVLLARFVVFPLVRK